MEEEPDPDKLALLRDKVKTRLKNMPDKEFNVLVVGMPGAGKSSFINSMIMCVTGTWHPVAHYAKSHVSVTRYLESYVMFDENCHEVHEPHPIPGYKKNVVFWDCPGFPDANEEAYSTIVSLTLDGRVPTDTRVLIYQNQNLKELQSKFERVDRNITFDRVVFILSASKEADVPELLATAIKSGAQQGHDVPIFVVVTKLDKSDDLQKRLDDAEAALSLKDNQVRFKTTSLYCKDVTGCTDRNDYRVMMPNAKIDNNLLNTWMSLTDRNIKAKPAPPPTPPPTPTPPTTPTPTPASTRKPLPERKCFLL